MIKQALILLLLLGFTQGATVFAEGMTAREILERIEDAEWRASSRSLARKTIITARGVERKSTLLVYALDGNQKQLIRFIEPARVRGSIFLMLNEGDDIWFHAPRTGRTRKLAAHMRRRRMLGSDFRHEDMAKDWQRDFTATLIGEEREDGRLSYKLKLIPTPEGPAYSKVFLWVDKEIFLPLRIDYYDEDGRLLKRLLMNEIEEINGRMTPMRYTMENLQEGGKTIIEVIEIEFDIPLREGMFTPGEIGR